MRNDTFIDVNAHIMRMTHVYIIDTSSPSYWTDNGAYYYYMPSNASAAPSASASAAPSASGNMQDTILGVLSYWRSLSLPLRHVMYDSWW
jgi:hypothetical protein